jgi:arsenate reductase-like glutaredoxin family protein
MAAPSPAMPVAPGTPPGNAPNILAPQPQLPAGAHAPRITIYGASWCGACHQAAAWLRANHIPFVEHDIETEPQAAQEMMARARQQGVPTGSIPIIDINGRLTVGFNPGLIQQALQNPAG